MLLEIAEVIAVEVIAEAEDDIIAGVEEIVAGADGVAVEVDKDDVLSTVDEVVAGVLVCADLELVADVMIFADDDELVLTSTIGMAVVPEEADAELDTAVDVEVLILLATKSVQVFKMQSEAVLPRHSDDIPILTLPLEGCLIRTKSRRTKVTKVIRRRVVDGSLIQIIRIATYTRLNTSLDEDLLPFQRYVPSYQYLLYTKTTAFMPSNAYSRCSVAQRMRRFA